MRILVMLGVLLLAGCMSDQESLLRQGYDPAYAQGFNDGGQSGSRAAGNIWTAFHKDTHRFESDSQYRQGWQDGFVLRKSQYEAISRMYDR